MPSAAVHRMARSPPGESLRPTTTEPSPLMALAYDEVLASGTPRFCIPPPAVQRNA